MRNDESLYGQAEVLARCFEDLAFILSAYQGANNSTEAFRRANISALSERYDSLILQIISRLQKLNEACEQMDDITLELCQVRMGDKAATKQRVLSVMTTAISSAVEKVQRFKEFVDAGAAPPEDVASHITKPTLFAQSALGDLGYYFQPSRVGTVCLVELRKWTPLDISMIKANSAVTAALVIDRDGKILEGAIPAAFDDNDFIARALEIYGNSEQMTRNMQHDRLHQIVLTAEEGHILISEFGVLLLVTVCNLVGTHIDVLPITRLIAQASLR